MLAPVASFSWVDVCVCVLCAEMEKIESPDYVLSPPSWQVVSVTRLSSHKTNI